MNDLQLLAAASAFIDSEADLLDHGEFNQWLTLWDPAGHYIVPIDPHATEFASVLNYAFDDAEMRARRVTRLYSGESISTTPRARTVRMLGRQRLVSASEQGVEIRAAQSLWEYRKGHQRHYVADVSWMLQPTGDSFLIQQKVIRLMGSEDHLSSIGYIL